ILLASWEALAISTGMFESRYIEVRYESNAARRRGSGTVKTPKPQSRPASTRRSSPGRKTSPTEPVAPPHPNQFPIVAIGVSAGGLEAFRELLTQLPL